MQEGTYHLNQFNIPDTGIDKKGEAIYPFQYMSGDQGITPKQILDIVGSIKFIGNDVRDRKL